MKITEVCLPDAEHVQAFVETLTALEGDFELLSGNYIIDARSLMSIFSLDLSKPIKLKIYNDSERNMRAIAPYVCVAGKEGD